MTGTMLFKSSHRRWNPLKQEWVIVSPHRTARPWQGQLEVQETAPPRGYDADCYLCPGNIRASGKATPNYDSTYVFENDYAALRNDLPSGEIYIGRTGLLHAQVERGSCRVVCFHPRHDLTLATMEPSAIRRTLDTFVAEVSELEALENIRYVQVFENRGSAMGASNPHPHAQIWATEHIPEEPKFEGKSQREYFATEGTPLLSDYLKEELRERERVVLESETWVTVVPFWATWPFETLILPKRAFSRFAEIRDGELDGLAEMLNRLTSCYNSIFNCPFPYSMGFHPAPCDGAPHAGWLFHTHFYPLLLRSASVRKFMVGFELLGSPQRDTNPEDVAATLRTHCT